jgi:hypothetical protein
MLTPQRLPLTPLSENSAMSLTPPSQNLAVSMVPVSQNRDNTLNLELLID